MKYLRLYFTLHSIPPWRRKDSLRSCHARRYNLHTGRVGNESVDVMARREDRIRVLSEIIGRRALVRRDKIGRMIPR